MNASRRCGRGWHRWLFVSMTNRRLIEAGPHSRWACELTERCGRCRLTRVGHAADVPKRVRIGA